MRTQDVLARFHLDYGRYAGDADFLQLVERLSAVSPSSRFRARTAASAALIGDAVDVEMLKDAPAAIEFNITGCIRWVAELTCSR